MIKIDSLGIIRFLNKDGRVRKGEHLLVYIYLRTALNGTQLRKAPGWYWVREASKLYLEGLSRRIII